MDHRFVQVPDAEEQIDPWAEQEACRCSMEEERVFRANVGLMGGLSMDKTRIALAELKFQSVQLMGEDAWREFISQCDLDNDSHINWLEFQFIVNHLLVEEARAFTAEAQRRIGKLREATAVDLEQSRGRAEELRELWRSVTPRKFLRWLEAMDDPETHEDRNRMLESLLFTVPLRDQDNRWRPGIGDKTLLSFGKLHGDRMVHDNVVVIESDVGFPLPEPLQTEGTQRARTRDLASEQLNFRRSGLISRIENYLLGNAEEKYHLAYTSIGLLDPEHLPYIVHALENAAVETKAFRTPIVNAILNVGWIRARKTFYFNMVLDFLVIVLLSRFAVDARNKMMPCQLVFAVLALLSTYHFFSDVLEFSVPLCRPGGRHRENRKQAWVFANKSMFGSFWSFFEVLMSAYFFVIMMGGLIVHWRLITRASPFEPMKEDWFRNHAIWVVALLAAKATHLIIKIMCVRALGQRVIPAYYAMTHASSKAFLLLLLLMFLDAVLTFHAVPIRIYEPSGADKTRWDPLENFFDLLILHFHSLILGESAGEKLEQEKEVMNLTVANGAFTGTFSGPSTHSKYHHGVYISVLSEQYSKAVRKDRELFEKFRAVFTRKTVTRCFWCMRRSSWRQRGGGQHVWIAYKKSTFPDRESQTYISMQGLQQFFARHLPDDAPRLQSLLEMERSVQPLDQSLPRGLWRSSPTETHRLGA